jgi:hypothetical protein
MFGAAIPPIAMLAVVATLIACDVDITALFQSGLTA